MSFIALQSNHHVSQRTTGRCFASASTATELPLELKKIVDLFNMVRLYLLLLIVGFIRPCSSISLPAAVVQGKNGPQEVYFALTGARFQAQVPTASGIWQEAASHASRGSHR